MVIALASAALQCQPRGPVELPAAPVQCTECQMTIADRRFAVQVHTDKGRVLFFDSIECARRYVSAHPRGVARVYLHSFLDPPRWIEGNEAWVLQWAGIRSPMGGNLGAFASEREARGWVESAQARPEEFKLTRWAELGR
ncbi:MAG: nitrous oxide reductase accessory protein NosL [Candidatus Binatia bacterium]|nr:nitrous oxide reductase accessory protein NosL [Candidatus Binatia bacterium]